MNLANVIGKTPALAAVSPQVLQRLAGVSRVTTMERGSHLWHAGDAPECLTIIRTGLIKVTKVGPQGRLSICGLFGAPDSVGDAALIRGVAYPADAVVATPNASLVEIPRKPFLRAMQEEPMLGFSCVQAVQAKLTTLHDKIEILSAGSVEARLAQLLLNLYERFGDDLEDESKLVPIALSRRELGDLVSTTLETTIRVMTRWEREGIVDTTPRGFIIRKLDELAKLVQRKPSTSPPVPDRRS